jgi:putative N6-adenine-specific DNA methylase
VTACPLPFSSSGLVTLTGVPVSELTTEWKNGVLICNPPYGERLMDKQEVKKLYRQMRTVFDRIPDWQINVITASREFESIYGKPADRRRKLSNGGMPCTLYQFYA